MYFKIYHKRSKQLVTKLNEEAIVDFCAKNIDVLTNYYFSAGGEEDLLEWEAFAFKYADLFDKKIESREEDEARSENGDFNFAKKSLLKLPTIIFVLLLTLSLTAAYFYYKSNVAEKEAALVAKNVENVRPRKKLERRALTEADKKFVAVMPTEKELAQSWKRVSYKLKSSLTLDEIKENMDSILPGLDQCFSERVEAGDIGLKGTMNMKIRVSGDGVVRDVLLLDEKYAGTLFGDCIISLIKSKPFEMFKSREQIFSYYWDL